MNSYERFQRRLAGEPVDRPPNFDIFMTFAANYIGQPLSAYYKDYRVLVEANLAMVEDFEIDILQAISDPYRETSDFGGEIEFPHDDLNLSHVPLLTDYDDLKKLKKPDPYTGKRMSDRLNAIRVFREQAGGEVPIMGWVEGALAEAADLRGVSEVMFDLIKHPQWVEELLEITVEVAIDFARAQIEAGADIIGLGDAVGSLISPRMYRKFALPYEQRIFAAVHEMGAVARLHICGNTGKIVGDMVDSGADIVDLDYMVDWKSASETYGDRVSLLGNFDPVTVMLQGTEERVMAAAQECMIVGGPRAFSGAGCEIPRYTPNENLRAQNRALWELAAN